MPVGTGAETLNTIPSEPYVVDPAAFFQRTEKNVMTVKTFSTPGPGQTQSAVLPQVGIVSKLMLKFVGTVTVATAAATTGAAWPYNLASKFTLSANGQNDLWSCSGIDLKCLRFLRYPAYTDVVDQFPGSVGGGNSVAVGTYVLDLTWEVPIAMDDTSLVASLYAQSASTVFTTWVTQATNSDLFSANPANVTIAGTWSIQTTTFEIPFDDAGKLIIPDTSRLHGFNAVDVPYTNVGDVRAPLIRSAGQLTRLLVSVSNQTGNRLSAMPNAVASNKIDRLRLTYGGNQVPLDWNPASLLLSLNNQHYGAPVPYDRLVMDFVRENPARDAVLMLGVTELNVIPTVNSAVTVSSGAAVRVVQETLF